MSDFLQQCEDILNYIADPNFEEQCRIDEQLYELAIEKYRNDPGFSAQDFVQHISMHMRMPAVRWGDLDDALFDEWLNRRS